MCSIYLLFVCSVLNLTHAKIEPLTKFLPLILDKLIGLMVKPIIISNIALNISQTVFEAIAIIVKNITVSILVNDCSFFLLIKFLICQ